MTQEIALRLDRSLLADKAPIETIQNLGVMTARIEMVLWINVILVFGLTEVNRLPQDHEAIDKLIELMRDCPWKDSVMHLPSNQRTRG